MPTAATTTFTQSKVVPFINPNLAAVKDIKIGASKTLVAGTIMAQVTATPGVYDAYATGGAGGLGTPLGILMYDVTTDSNGVITSISGPFAVGQADMNVPMWYAGVFKCDDIHGDTVAHAITDGLGKIIEGDSLTGLWRIP